MEIYFNDLNEEAKENYLDFMDVNNADELNHEISPLAILDHEDEEGEDEIINGNIPKIFNNGNNQIIVTKFFGSISDIKFIQKEFIKNKITFALMSKYDKTKVKRYCYVREFIRNEDEKDMLCEISNLTLEAVWEKGELVNII